MKKIIPVFVFYYQDDSNVDQIAITLPVNHITPEIFLNINEFKKYEEKIDLQYINILSDGLIVPNWTIIGNNNSPCESISIFDLHYVPLKRLMKQHPHSNIFTGTKLLKLKKLIKEQLIVRAHVYFACRKQCDQIIRSLIFE